MKKQRWIPLAVLAVVILLLAVSLLVLQGAEGEEETQAIPLCSFSADEVDGVSYAGNNLDVTLIRGREGNWMLDSDPTLPLDQATVEGLVEDFVNLSAQRALRDDERGELPGRKEIPLMRLEIAAGEESLILSVDQLNELADVYYVYDEAGDVYTVASADLEALCLEPRDLYAAQTLTGESAADVTSMTVNGIAFTYADGTWTLTEEPDFALDQDAVQRMANTICQMQTEWSITAPDGDYGLDEPDVTAVLWFADGTSLEVHFGGLKPEDETLCYLEADSVPGVVFEVSAVHKSYFTVSKSSLAAASTPETAESIDDIIAESPVGGIDDYAE